MNGTAARFVRFSAGLLGLVGVAWILSGQVTSPEEQGLPTDWTHRHVIFSQPATAKQAAQVERDPRYWQQLVRRSVVRSLSEDGSAPVDQAAIQLGVPARRVHRDWAQNMGTGATAGAGNYPAKYSFQTTTASCASAANPDYVVFSTGLLGSASQASITAYVNLYSGCTGIVPAVYWAYNTGGQILTSPVISGDGKQVAFVQTNPTLSGEVVLLKWAASGGPVGVGAAVTLTSVPRAAYRNCTAPCMTTITLRTDVGVPVR